MNLANPRHLLIAILLIWLFFGAGCGEPPLAGGVVLAKRTFPAHTVKHVEKDDGGGMWCGAGGCGAPAQGRVPIGGGDDKVTYEHVPTKWFVTFGECSIDETERSHCRTRTMRVDRWAYKRARVGRWWKAPEQELSD